MARSASITILPITCTTAVRTPSPSASMTAGSQHHWYAGAGINRQVRLVTTASTHIDPWGTFVTTPFVSTGAASIHIRSTVTDQSTTSSTVRLQVSLIAPDGRLVKTFSSVPRTIAARASTDLEAETTIANPDRWDLDHPALYTVHAIVLDHN